MRVAELDEVTYDLEIDGEQVRRTLHRRVWERGAWATVAIAYEERGPDGGWKPARLAMIRLQRVRDAWKQHAAITLRGSDALGLAQALGEWQGAFGAAGASDPADPADSIEAPGSLDSLDGPDE
jgi:hypothetical protein